MIADPRLRWERPVGAAIHVVQPTGRVVHPHGLQRKAEVSGVWSDVAVVVPQPADQSPGLQPES